MSDILANVYFLLVPAIVFISIPSILVGADRIPFSARSIGLALFCVALLPIRMWESVVLVISAAVAGTIMRVSLSWIERTRFRTVAINPFALILLSVAGYCSAQFSPVPLNDVDLGPLFALGGTLRWFEWASIGVLGLIGIPMLVIRVSKIRASKRDWGRSDEVQIESRDQRVTLRDLAWLLLSFAIGFASLRVAWLRCSYFTCPTYLVIGALAGCWIAAFAWLIRLKHSWAWLPFSLHSILLSAGWLEALEPEPTPFEIGPWNVVGLTQFLIGFGCAAVSAFSLWTNFLRANHRSRKSRTRCRLAVGLVLLLLFLPTIRICAFMFRPWLTPPQVEQIDGNQYSELVALMDQIDPVNRPPNLVLDRISNMVKSDALIEVPDLMAKHSFKQMDTCKAFASDASRLAWQGERAEGLDRLLTSILMNQRLAIGGGTTDLLMRGACNDVPLRTLFQQRKHWNDWEIKFVQKRLSEAAQVKEPLRMVNSRSQLHAEYVYPWLDGLLDYDVCQGKLDGLLSKRVRDREPDRDIEAIEMKDAVWLELLITDCAIRRFTTATGRRPDALDELVPQFLDVVPLDPFADKPLTYRSNDRSYELYSYGRNRMDDGGVRSGSASDIYLPTN